MRELLIAFSIGILTQTLHAQTGVYWDNEVIVSDGQTYGKLRPRITLNASGNPVIVYGNTNAINVSVWNGTSFNTPVNVLPAGMQNYISGWTGPDIASAGDTVIVVFKQSTLETGNVYSVRSTDGGLTFSDTIRVDSHDTGVAWMPSLDMNDQGEITVAFMIHDANWANPRYAVVHSSDAGLSYSDEIEIVSTIPGEACDCCPSEVVMDGTQRTMLFRNNDANIRDIYAVHSSNNGASYDFEENVDQTNWSIAGCPSTGPHGAIVGNSLITTFASSATGNYRNYVTVSDISTGLTFQNSYSQNDPSSNQNYPRINNSSDTIVLAWREYFGASSEIYVSVASGGQYMDLINNGVIANQTTQGTQTNPDIQVLNGIVHLCYQDDFQNAVIYRSGVVQDVTGIETNSSGDITIYPNPAKDRLTISNLNIENITLIDNQGRIFKVEMIDNNGLELNLEKFNSGSYNLKIETQDGNVVNKKLIIE
jgi:hypothetical protein